MTLVKRSRVVSYSCEQMYDLVNRIEDYEQFLPFIRKGTVHHRDESEVQATLEIEAAGLSKSFTTRNRLQANKMIEISLVDGPFKHLHGFWRFDKNSNGQGSVISFDLEFEFSGYAVSMFLGPIFEQIADKMVDSFCSRAQDCYETAS